MSKFLNEKKVLKTLGIVDFRHLTKNKVISMASMLDKMDPEVAIKAMEQFPEFSTTTKEILNDFKDTLDKGLESNKESVQAYYSACALIIDSLQKRLEKEDLSLDERKYIIDKMLFVSKEMGEKDSENKKFIIAMSVIGATVFGAAVYALASALGGNNAIEESDGYDEDDYEY